MSSTNGFVRRVSSIQSSFWIILAFDILAITLAVSRALLRQKSPMRYFEETGIMSFFSGLQLLIIAGLSLRISFIRQQIKTRFKSWKSPQNLWRIMAIGFVFLAADEIFEIHENIDKLIHQGLRITETALTDRIDDLIIVSYSLIGGYILYSFWQEFKRYQPAFCLFIVGFVLKAAMVIFDLYTNNEMILSSWITDPQVHELVYDSLRTVEESLKILAEGAFIAAFCACLNLAKQITRTQWVGTLTSQSNPYRSSKVTRRL